jgi:hypothetical protein
MRVTQRRDSAGLKRGEIDAKDGEAKFVPNGRLMHAGFKAVPGTAIISSIAERPMSSISKSAIERLTM